MGNLWVCSKCKSEPSDERSGKMYLCLKCFQKEHQAYKLGYATGTIVGENFYYFIPLAIIAVVCLLRYL